MPADTAILAELRLVPASKIESAIALLNVRPRNDGVLAPGLRCVAANSRYITTLGYAVTVHAGVTTATRAVENFDWYAFVEHLPGPKVLCVTPAEPGSEEGVLLGQMTARILAGLGVVGAIVDGYVRDSAALEEIGFPVLAQGTMLRRGAPHVVEYGQPVTIRGCRIANGSIVALDSDGALTFSRELLPRVPEGLTRLQRRKDPVLKYLQSTQNLTASGIVAAQSQAKGDIP